MFVSVMVLGEFATSAALSGRKVNLLGNIIVTQVGSLKWALASVVGVILTVIMGLVIAVASTTESSLDRLTREGIPVVAIDRRVTGHNIFGADGKVHVYTEGNTSTDKAAGYFDVNRSLSALHALP